MEHSQSNEGFDACLVMRAKSGDHMALKRLLYHASPKLREVIDRKLPKEFRRVIAADDVFQETAIAIQLGIQTLKTDCPEKFMAWARRVAENKLNSQIRAELTKKRGGDHERVSSENESSIVNKVVDDGPSPVGNVESDEIVYAIKSNLDDLPPTMRTALKYVHFDSLTYKEAAQKLGETPAKVRSLLDKAFKMMRNAMGHSSKWLSKK